MILKFKDIFKYGDENLDKFFSPGRVNLIGEHTDYNGGNVFPCAINFGTYAIASKREDNKVRVFSLNFEEEGVKEFTLDNLKNIKEDNWANYVKAVVYSFKKDGFKIEKGFDLVVYGDIPNGAGLSSSASLELLISEILKVYNNLDIDTIDMVKLSQKAENEFIGVNCGIMDQFAIGMGKKDKAIFLDTNLLKYEFVPIDLKGIKIVIANTNKRRGLMDSKYNERRSECEEALKDIKEHKNINSLGELTEENLDEALSYIKRDVCKLRARHAVLENRRTIKAVELLNKSDISGFGKLMNDSHASLRDYYEVTGIELDTLVDLAQKTEGVIGSRMTGAGFGGCTISLVKEEKVDEF
ncbi:galactokinase, partial [Clostridium chrysemydis]|uniref:galactokinase n=1 Tax=Clostridium chrysemydis TaxID=2665504 RepID=UPI003F2F81DF